MGVRAWVCRAAIPSRSCPLWVKSGYRCTSNQCPLYTQKQTSEPAHVSPSTQQLRQLGDIRRDPPRGCTQDCNLNQLSTKPRKLCWQPRGQAIDRQEQELSR